MQERSSRIAIVAGEASGDLLGAHLMAALRRRRPALQFYGIGGTRMLGEGLESLYPMEPLSVRGLVEVLGHYRELAAVRRNLGTRLLAERPAALIGVDAPDFNLALERRVKEAGIPAVHYVSPSVWAWRRWRIPGIARSVTHLLALFPFEPALYEGTGLSVTYVGHPLADLVPLETNKAEARAQLKLSAKRMVVALLPGSRRTELKYMADLFVKTARRLLQDMPEAHFVYPAASRATRELFDEALRRHEATELPLTLLFGHSHEALAAADLALVASGTATLEAALFNTPMVITYRQSPITSALMRRMAHVRFAGLPNILAGEPIVSEYLQGAADPGVLAEALLALAHDAEARRAQLEHFRQIHVALRQDAAQKAADAVLRVLDEARA